MSRNQASGSHMLPGSTKISNQKLYEYIKKIEIDGMPRVRAYAEAIDAKIYELSPQQQQDRLDNLRRRNKSYQDVKEMVLAEQEDWILRKSATIQNKAVELLANVIDKANDIASNPETDAKELNAAISALKTIMPAFTGMNNKSGDVSVGQQDRKSRAGKYIN